MSKICPECNGKTKTFDTRSASYFYQDGSPVEVIRRKRCNDCDHTFTTLETIVNDITGRQGVARVRPKITGPHRKDSAPKPTDTSTQIMTDLADIRAELGL